MTLLGISDFSAVKFGSPESSLVHQTVLAGPQESYGSSGMHPLHLDTFGLV